MRLHRVTHGMYPAAGGGVPSVRARLVSPRVCFRGECHHQGLSIWLSLAPCTTGNSSAHVMLSPRFGRVRSQAWCDDACSPPLVRGVGSPGWEPRTAWGWADTRGFGLKKSCRMYHRDAGRDDTFGRPKRCEDATPPPNPRRFEITSLANQHPESAAAQGHALGIARIVIP